MCFLFWTLFIAKVRSSRKTKERNSLTKLKKVMIS
ncbi:peptidylprolyl isomerase PrsA, partial [Listeria monocytogenes]|nr:peptidylprolyl isomerase PrsA [Listeria monocytogenes]